MATNEGNPMSRMKQLLCPAVLALAACLHIGCAQNSAVERSADGVIMPAGNGFVNVTVRSPDVFHVQYAADKTFFNHPSISALPNSSPAPSWVLTTDAGSATLSTEHLKAKIDLKTGAVSFLDASGTPVLAEKPDGRTVEPAVVQGEQTFHVRQQWQGDPGESLYGMGELQLGITDIKNWDLDFWQHNGTVVSPFLVSSKGYGILWDNPSYTRFGDLGKFVPIPSEALIDDNGNAGALSTGPFTDPAAKLQNPTTAPTIALAARGRGRARGGPGRPGAQGGTRWEGQLAPTVTGDYQFQTYSNGAIRVWLNGNLVIDHFRQSWLPWYDIARIHMEAGEHYPIKIEWSADGQGNQLSVAWKPPVADRDAQGTSLWSEVGGGIDYYFCYGPSLDHVISGFRNITGRANMLPDWALGYWQSRDHYSNQQQSVDAVAEFRKRRIPLDNIVQDWQYWPGASLDTVGSWAFDPARYPDPLAWTKAIHDQHAHLMISVWGWISAKSQPNNNYQEMLARNYLLAVNGGRDARTFVDFFNPDAGKLFWKQLNAEMFSKGIDAWWLDAAEPDLAGTPTLDAMRTLMNPNGMGTGAKVLNAYPIMESKAVYEGQREVAPDRRVFILTRSGYPGMQRYSAVVWSGDSTSTWPAMRNQIMAGLGFSISGMPYWSMDIGGYQPPQRLATPRTAADRDEWDELNTRWFQFGTFVPIMRIHGQGARELFNFGDNAVSAMTRYDRLRYALMPYIYSLAGDVTQNDGTIMRPLVMDFPSDAAAREVSDQYMFGPAFLVSPVCTYKARSRPVYLPPAAQWYEFWSGAAQPGGQTIDADAPFDSMPLFIRSGSIIPTAPVAQYTGEKPHDPITLYVYAGQDGVFSLYEDEGTNYNYEQGAFSRIPITWNQASQTLTIGKRQGSFPGMLQQRTFNVIFVSKDKPVGFAFEGNADHSVTYTGEEIAVNP
jgi:alpha-D-xyloside xylohydrolase